MTALFNRWLPGFTLLAWSAVLLVFYISGRIASILHPDFRLNVLVAGLVMLVMACCFLFLPGVASCCNDDRCGHPLGRRKAGRILTFLVLILPIATAAMFSPKGFSLQTVLNRGVATDARGLVSGRYTPHSPPPGQQSSTDPTEPPLPTKSGVAATPAVAAQSSSDDYLPKSKDGNIVVQVIDLLYAAQDDSMRADFTGKTIEIIGQMMPDDSNNASGNRFKLMRMFMWCCAADAKPIAALIEAPSKPAAPEMSWVKVVGKVSFPIEGGRMIPVVTATSVQQTNPPADTMLY